MFFRSSNGQNNTEIQYERKDKTDRDECAEKPPKHNIEDYDRVIDTAKILLAKVFSSAIKQLNTHELKDKYDPQGDMEVSQSLERKDTSSNETIQSMNKKVMERRVSEILKEKILKKQSGELSTNFKEQDRQDIGQNKGLKELNNEVILDKRQHMIPELKTDSTASENTDIHDPHQDSGIEQTLRAVTIVNMVQSNSWKMDEKDASDNIHNNQTLPEDKEVGEEEEKGLSGIVVKEKYDQDRTLLGEGKNEAQEEEDPRMALAILNTNHSFNMTWWTVMVARGLIDPEEQFATGMKTYAIVVNQAQAVLQSVFRNTKSSMVEKKCESPDALVRTSKYIPETQALQQGVSIPGIVISKVVRVRIESECIVEEDYEDDKDYNISEDEDSNESYTEDEQDEPEEPAQDLREELKVQGDEPDGKTYDGAVAEEVGEKHDIYVKEEEVEEREEDEEEEEEEDPRMMLAIMNTESSFNMTWWMIMVEKGLIDPEEDFETSMMTYVRIIKEARKVLGQVFASAIQFIREGSGTDSLNSLKAITGIETGCKKALTSTERDGEEETQNIMINPINIKDTGSPSAMKEHVGPEKTSVIRESATFPSPGETGDKPNTTSCHSDAAEPQATCDPAACDCPAIADLQLDDPCSEPAAASDENIRKASFKEDLLSWSSKFRAVTDAIKGEMRDFGTPATPPSTPRNSSRNRFSYEGEKVDDHTLTTVEQTISCTYDLTDIDRRISVEDDGWIIIHPCPSNTEDMEQEENTEVLTPNTCTHHDAESNELILGKAMTDTEVLPHTQVLQNSLSHKLQFIISESGQDMLLLASIGFFNVIPAVHFVSSPLHTPTLLLYKPGATSGVCNMQLAGI